MARLTGRLAPKSIVASGTGLYLAQNVMYQHTISVFDATKQLVETLEDTVDLRAFGYDVPGEAYRGAPVEAAFTSDGSHVFVSNYRSRGDDKAEQRYEWARPARRSWRWTDRDLTRDRFSRARLAALSIG